MHTVKELFRAIAATHRRREDSRRKRLSEQLVPTFVRFFLNESPARRLAAVAAGLVAGASSAAILVVINEYLRGSRWPAPYLLALFVLLVATRLGLGVVSSLQLSRFHQEVVIRFGMSLCQQILAAPLRQVERLGSHRLLAALTEDVNSITEAIHQVAGFCINIATALAALAYLAWLSPLVFVLVLTFTVGGLIIHQVLLRAASAKMALARDQEDRLFGHYRAVAQGPKELKLHVARRTEFLFDSLQPAAVLVGQSRVLGRALFTVATTWGSLLSYVVIGLLLFGLHPFRLVTSDVLSACVLTVLQMLGSVAVLASGIPVFVRADVSLRKLQELGLTLAPEETTPVPPPRVIARRWQRIELVGVTHEYERDGQDATFTLGPIDLTLRPGELVFISGGNGSGKTTLAKIIAGLYLPQSGEIRVDGEPVTEATREQYRQNFSAIFPDFYLFDVLFGLNGADLDARARDCLRMLRLDHKVSVADRRLSTTQLSEGQRKRLALLTASLEDRPIYVFDEWAADQDFAFRHMFYTEILPEMKRRQKSVVVITHDERYFGVADRLVRLEYGRLAPPAPQSAGGIPVLSA